MIRRLFARLIPGRKTHDPKIYRADAHAVRREQVPRGARAVTEKLQEAGFKAFARALRQAVEPDPRRAGAVPSSKGVLERAGA